MFYTRVLYIARTVDVSSTWIPNQDSEIIGLVCMLGYVHTNYLVHIPDLLAYVELCGELKGGGITQSFLPLSILFELCLELVGVLKNSSHAAIILFSYSWALGMKEAVSVNKAIGMNITYGTNITHCTNKTHGMNISLVPKHILAHNFLNVILNNI